MNRLGLVVAIMLGAVMLALEAAPSRATFAGNNGKIAFTSNRDAQADIYVMNANGGQQTRLTTDLASDFVPRWSPSGARIAFVSERDGNSEIYSMYPDGTHQTRLTNDLLRDNYPSWTADGSQIVFQRGGFASGEIYVMNADGSGQRNLTSNPAGDFTPAASSRDSKIVFGSDRGGSGGLYTMRLDGSSVTRITSTSGMDSFPNWAPSGNDIVFVRNEAGDDDIYTVHADGTGLRRLTNTPARDEASPVWSPDRTKVLFGGCVSDGNCQLYTIKPDGTGEQQLTSGSFGPPPAAPYAETFDDNAVNPAFWTIFGPAGTSPPTLTAQNAQLEVNIPADSVSDPGLGALAVQVASRCLLGGDFDFQVDYRLLEWPAHSGIVVALGGEPDNFVGRVGGSSGGNDFYFSDFPPLAYATLDTTDLSGSLRLVRTGATSTAYVLQGGTWTPILSGATAPEDELITLTVYSTEATFGHQAAKVAFDNFELNSGSFNPTTCGELQNNLPDWQAVPRSG
jgi:Tol biopolymer transport system component